MERHKRDLDSPDDARIASLVNDYFDRRQAGEDITPDSFLAEHPDLADQLQPYLDGLTLLDQVRTATGGGARAVVATTPNGSLPQVAGYELIKEIGRGGMGVVYKALQISTNRIVALKVMLAGPFASPRGQERFIREVQLAARLNHPSIVTVLESGEVSTGQSYFAMNFVDGVHLDTYIARNRPDVRTTLEMALLICDAVHYAHEVRVIHRDLKPANVLIDENGHPHILDFGLAKATDQAEGDGSLGGHCSATGQVLGTLRYLSPEQAAGASGDSDIRTDVYALGLMIYEALTRTMPYDMTGRPAEIIRRIIEVPPATPSSVSRHLDTDLDTILLTALEKEPAHRYGSVREMAEEIRRYLRGDPLLTRRASRLYVLGKKLRKHRNRIALGVVSFALGLLGAWGASLWQQHSLAVRQAAELAEGRRHVLRLQHELEDGWLRREYNRNVLGGALIDHGSYPSIREAALVVAQAKYEDGKDALLHPRESNSSENTKVEVEKDPYKLAILWLQEKLIQDPSHWACRALLAELYRLRHRDPEFAQPNDLEQAVAYRAQAEREQELTAEGWYLTSFATLDYNEAMRCAREATRVDPTHSLAWERLTYLAMGMHDFDLAVQCLDNLRRLQPEATEWATLRTFVFDQRKQALEGAMISVDGAGTGDVFPTRYLETSSEAHQPTTTQPGPPSEGLEPTTQPLAPPAVQRPATQPAPPS